MILFCRKLAGKPAVYYPPRDRKPCVGMCFRPRSSGDKVAEKRMERKARKSCLGLCFIAKLKKTSTASPHMEDESVKTTNDGEIYDENDDDSVTFLEYEKSSCLAQTSINFVNNLFFIQITISDGYKLAVWVSE